MFIIGLYYLEKKFAFVNLSSFSYVFQINFEFLLDWNLWYFLSEWCNCNLDPSMSVLGNYLVHSCCGCYFSSSSSFHIIIIIIVHICMW